MQEQRMTKDDLIGLMATGLILFAIFVGAGISGCESKVREIDYLQLIVDDYKNDLGICREQNGRLFTEFTKVKTEKELLYGE